MAYGTITQQSTSPGGSATESFDMRGPNGLLMRVVNVVGDGAYVTGGRALSAASLGFPNAVVFGQAEIAASTGVNATSTAASVLPQGDGSMKLLCLTSVNAEVAAAVNVSGVTWQLLLWGW